MPIPRQRVYALMMDTTSSTDANNLNEAMWTVDMSGLTSPTLTFSTITFADETGRCPPAFAGHYNGDGVAISADGTTGTRSGPASPATWTRSQ